MRRTALFAALAIPVLFGMAIVLSAESARAEDAPPAPVAPVIVPAVAGGPCAPCDPCGPWWAPKRWQVELTLGAWLAKMDGTVGVRGRTADVNVTFEETLDTLADHFDGILQGSADVSHGRWHLRGSVSWIRLKEDEAAPNAGIGPLEAVVEQLQAQATVGYRLGASQIGCDPCAPWILYDVFVGARWFDMEVELTDPAGAQVTASKSWVDPIVGGRIALDLYHKWIFDLEADIGGFGVGSDLTWRVRTGVEWWPTRSFGLKAGWLWLDTDYESGSGANRFVWDILQDGPYLAASFKF